MNTIAFSRRIALKSTIVGCSQLLFSEQSLAGGQLEEPLIDSVRTALSSAVANQAPPIPEFKDTEAKLAQLSYSVRGLIPDGLLVRVSSIDNDVHAAFEAQQGFIIQLGQAISPDVRPMVMGSADSGQGAGR